jgi:hypothetical protein
MFVNAYPWLFPGGIGDINDGERGQVKSIREWANHLIHYYDGRFQSDQLFTLYVFNTIQRHDNNKNGGYFFTDKNWLGKNPPSLEELKDQIRNGEFKFVSKLRYFAQQIRGSDAFWRSKTNELESWIDFHVSRHHGPPTHFITLTCAENWWPDLRNIMYDLEVASEKGNVNEHAKKLKNNDFSALRKSVAKYPLYVNQYFMKRANEFMDGYARDVLGIEYYWGRVEFAAGRGQIHLHILGIAKNKAYLHDFYRAETEQDKTDVMEKYATRMLDLTADTQVDENHDKLDQNTKEITSPLGIRFGECTDEDRDHRLLAQDCMYHDCNDYCLGEVKKTRQDGQDICRKCRFGFGTEKHAGERDTEGKGLHEKAKIVKDHKGVEHFYMPRRYSERINQHSRSLLQAWRANADVQLLIYRSDPNLPDVGEIESVCRYVVAYAGKRYKTCRQEINMIQDVILR